MRWLCTYSNVQQLILLTHADMKKLNTNSPYKQCLEVSNQVKHDPFMCLSRQMCLLATWQHVCPEKLQICSPQSLQLLPPSFASRLVQEKNWCAVELIQVSLCMHS